MLNGAGYSHVGELGSKDSQSGQCTDEIAPYSFNSCADAMALDQSSL